MELNNFNASEYEDYTSNFGVIPAGEYKAEISASEFKKTKAGDGSYIKFTFDIVDGDFKGRKIFSNINFENSNLQAQAIGRSQLATICRAVGNSNAKRTEDLHKKVMIIQVKVRPGTTEYPDPQNEIKGWKSIASAGSGIETKLPPYLSDKKIDDIY